MALVFAMSGTALAAKHYLINSTKQIKPSVLKSLEGRTGKTGPQGPAGAPGSPGLTGKEGPAGQSALSPLPSGDSESGSYGAGSAAGKAHETLETAASFPIPLAAPVTQVVYTAVGSPVAHCSGPGHAEKGFLCVYSVFSVGLKTPPDHHEHGNARPRRRGPIWLSHRVGTHRIQPGSGGHLHRDSAVGPQLVDQTPSRCQTFRAPRRTLDCRTRLTEPRRLAARGSTQHRAASTGR